MNGDIVSQANIADVFDSYRTPEGFTALDEVTSEDEYKHCSHKSTLPAVSKEAVTESDSSTGTLTNEDGGEEEDAALSKPAGLSPTTWQRMLALKDRLADDKKRLRDFVISMREKKDNDEGGGGVSDSLIRGDMMTVGGRLGSTTTPVPLELIRPASVDGRISSGAESESAGDDDNKDEDFDMFALISASPQKRKRPAKPLGARKRIAIAPELQAVDSFDDAEGYYKPIVGELLDNRYLVLSGICGKGVFSSVIRCIDEKHAAGPSEVAVKIIRNNDLMRKAGDKEAEILRRLNAADKENRKHVVRLLGTLDHKRHLCLVFESLSLNLRSLLKKYGNGRGLNLQVVMTYARQVMLALRHMKKNGLMHADIKPDNILVNADLNSIKVCDFGSAADITENEITAYLVSRFYRAPEIILGSRYGYPIDVWSTACTLYELAVGKILFTGRDNNNMLYQIMTLKGRFSKQTLKNSAFASKHFAEDFTDFLLAEFDHKTRKTTIRRVSIPQQPVKSMFDFLIVDLVACQGSDPKAVALRHKARQFAKFLDRCLVLDPAKRMTPEEALQHPFLREPIMPVSSPTINGPPASLKP